jgi:MoaD family protein
MMKVKISFLSLLAELFGKEVISISIDDNLTINDILDHLSTRFGSTFEQNILDNSDSLNKYILIGLNGKDIRLFNDLKTILHDGDEISFLPAIAGG